MWQQQEEARMVAVVQGRGGVCASVVELGGSCRSEGLQCHPVLALSVFLNDRFRFFKSI